MEMSGMTSAMTPEIPRKKSRVSGYFMVLTVEYHQGANDLSLLAE